MSDEAAQRTIKIETHGKAGLIRLDRPEALNALSDTLMSELGEALRAFDADPAIGAIVITGSERAFAAGADIREMKDRSFPDTFLNDFIGARWEAVLRVRKPVIAAVAGFALGGGCELAMMCDIVLAADTARFGQPEINLGIIPGAGGTQRLVRAVGKAKAMEMVLSGRMLTAEEAERANLVARVVPAAELIAEAIKLAQKIGGLSPVAVAMAKRAVNASFETTLGMGVAYERQLFLSLFGTADQREGMAAFLEKRAARFGQGCQGSKDPDGGSRG
ncbi:MAG TPA: enoyl-CoA hydratase-related protein [Acetobacteraceae bacterium]|nr:enoyl-CoA hydratase-related protein [Acetobacteraceae bacterium]